MKTHYIITLLLVVLAVESRAGPQPKTATGASREIATQDRSRELWQAQQQMAADHRAFIAAHANDTPEVRQQAMAAFRQQNQSRAEALRVKAQAIAEARVAPEIPMVTQVTIPQNATPAMEELMVQRAQMKNERAKLLNSLRNSTAAEKAAAIRNWQEKNQPALSALRDQASQVAAEKEPEHRPPLPPIRIPNGASAELRNSLVERRAQINERIAQVNQRRGMGADQQAPGKSPAPVQTTLGEAAVTTPERITSESNPKPKSKP